MRRAKRAARLGAVVPALDHLVRAALVAQAAPPGALLEMAEPSVAEATPPLVEARAPAALAEARAAAAMLAPGREERAAALVALHRSTRHPPPTAVELAARSTRDVGPAEPHRVPYGLVSRAYSLRLPSSDRSWPSLSMPIIFITAPFRTKRRERFAPCHSRAGHRRFSCPMSSSDRSTWRARRSTTWTAPVRWRRRRCLPSR